MAMAPRPYNLSLGILALLSPLCYAASSATTTTTTVLPGATVTGPPPHGAALQSMPRDAPSSAQGRLLRDPRSSSDRRRGTPPPSTLSDDIPPRTLSASPVARQGQGTSASPSPRAAPPAHPRPCGRVLDAHADAVDVDSIVPAPQRGASISGFGTAPPPPPAATVALLHAVAALPLIAAVPFLPLPVAALVALSSLAANPVRARSDDCYKLNHAWCRVYPYDNETGSVDRAHPDPDPDLGAVCLHPLCHAGSTERLLSVLNAQQHGRGDDPLHMYCAVRTLEGPPSILPWRNAWSVHLPIDNPAAAAAAGGGGICYVELVHLDYKEGYYIRCPVGERRQTFCTEFPEEAIAAAVWEHRRLNYRDTVGPRYARYQYKYKDEL